MATNREVAKLIVVERKTQFSLYSDGSLKSAFSGKPYEFYGTSFPAGTYFTFSLEGRLLSATLKDDTNINSINLPKGTIVGFNEKGGISRISGFITDLDIQGTKCSALGEVTFYESGRIKRALLAKDKVFDNNVGALAGDMVDILEDGRLRSVFITTDRPFDGIPCAAESTVEFHDDGMIARAVLSRDQRYRGYDLAVGTALSLYPDGGLKEIGLVADQEVKGYRCKGGSSVEFYDDGSLKELQLAGGTGIEYLGAKMRCQTGTKMKFYKGGFLAAFSPMDDVTIQGYKCRRGGWVEFYESGQLKACYTNDWSYIDNTLYPTSVWLELYEEGAPKLINYLGRKETDRFKTENVDYPIIVPALVEIKFDKNVARVKSARKELGVMPAEIVYNPAETVPGGEEADETASQLTPLPSATQQQPSKEAFKLPDPFGTPDRKRELLLP